MRTSRDHGLHRLLLYSHDTYGLGHLRRNLAIANHLLATVPGLQVVLMSGSPTARRFPLPRGLTLVSLPPVVKVGPEEYRGRDPRVDFAVVRQARAAIIADVARRFCPDVFLVDHAPHGMKGELLPALEALRNHSPATRIVLGLRDVLDDPTVVRQLWREQGVLDTLERVYDRVVVYGSRDLLDVAAEYGFPPAVLDRTSYCGYICRPQAAPSVAGPSSDDRFVLGTAGGGGDGLDVLIATLRAAEALALPSLLITGPFMSNGDRCDLAAAVRASRAGRMEEFVAGLETLLPNAAAVVSMAGYNTLCEVIPSGVPAVVVPRVWPRREQAIRARLFADRGLVHVVEPGPDLDARLTPVLRTALSQGRRRPASFDGEGLARLRGLLLAETERSGRDEPTRVAAELPA